MTAMSLLIGRFFLAIPALALAGRFAAQGRRHISVGTLPTDSLLFGAVMMGSALVIGGLGYFPALALGPVVEYFQMMH